MKLKKLLNKLYHGTRVYIDYYDSYSCEYDGVLGDMSIKTFNNIANRKVYSVSTSKDGAVAIVIKSNKIENV